MAATDNARLFWVKAQRPLNFASTNRHAESIASKPAGLYWTMPGYAYVRLAIVAFYENWQTTAASILDSDDEVFVSIADLVQQEEK